MPREKVVFRESLNLFCCFFFFMCSGNIFPRTRVQLRFSNIAALSFACSENAVKCKLVI